MALSIWYNIGFPDGVILGIGYGSVHRNNRSNSNRTMYASNTAIFGPSTAKMFDFRSLTFDNSYFLSLTFKTYPNKKVTSCPWSI